MFFIFNLIRLHSLQIRVSHGIDWYLPISNSIGKIPNLNCAMYDLSMGVKLKKHNFQYLEEF